MSVKAESLKPSAGQVEELLTLDAGVVNTLVSLNVHNSGTTSDVVMIWISTTPITSTVAVPQLFDTVNLGAKETLSRSCGHLAPDEVIYVHSQTGNSTIRASALME